MKIDKETGRKILPPVGTLRRDIPEFLGEEHDMTKNVIHGSDCEESAENQKKMIFELMHNPASKLATNMIRKAIYLESAYDVELTLVPNTQELTQEEAVIVSSKDIQDFINDKTEMVSVDEILSSTSNNVTTVFALSDLLIWTLKIILNILLTDKIKKI